jgi:large subunit ribosomal protein L25
VSEYELAVEVREGSGKGIARKLRASGRIPGVCYGGAEGPRSIHLDPHVLDRLITRSAAGVNTLIDLRGGGLDGKVVLVKELQRDPVKGTLLHADLYAIDADKTVEVEVPIHLTGTPVGVELGGGIMEHTLRELELECLPRAIPEEIRMDVSALELGDSLHVRDLPLPEGVTLVSDPDLAVVSVVAPRVEEEPTVEGEEAAAAAEGEAEGAAKVEGAAEGEESESKED